MSNSLETRVHLCGRFTLRINGNRMESEVYGPQGRLLLAFLVLNRHVESPRSRLVELLWGDVLPVDPDAALASLIAKLRKTLGKDALQGRSELRLVLPRDAWIDVEVGKEAVHRAEAAAQSKDWAMSWPPSQVVSHIFHRTFLPGLTGTWVDAQRSAFDAIGCDADDVIAEAGLHLDGHELMTAQRAAMRILARQPYNERAAGLMMQILSKRGNRAEALDTYERTRTLIRDELGVSPSDWLQSIHSGLLRSH